MNTYIAALLAKQIDTLDQFDLMCCSTTPKGAYDALVKRCQMLGIPVPSEKECIWFVGEQMRYESTSISLQSF